MVQSDSDRPPGRRQGYDVNCCRWSARLPPPVVLAPLDPAPRRTQELVEFVVPMAREGVAAQEPTLLLVRPDTAEAVLHQVGPSPYLTVQPALAQPGRPALHGRAAPLMLASYARVVHQRSR